MFTPEPWDLEGRDWRELIARFERALSGNATAFFEDEALERIIEHYQDADDLRMALLAVNYALNINPYNAVFYVRKAETLFEMRHYREAYRCTEIAAIYDPSEIELYYLRADIHTARSEFESAVSALQEALERADKVELPNVWAELAQVYEEAEDFDRVFECLQESLKLDPRCEDALEKLWFCVDVTERYEASVNIHKSLIDRDPYSHRAWYNLGKAYFGMGLYEKAAEAYGFVVAIDERYNAAYRDLGETWYRLGRFQTAINYLLQAIDLGEGHEELYFRIGQCREKMGEYAGARHHYRKATQQDPYYDMAFFRMGCTYLAEEKLEEALRLFRKASQLDPENSRYKAETGRLLYQMDDPEAALISYREALRIRPDYPAHWVQFSRMLFDTGAKTQAVEAAKEAIKHCGEDPMLIYLHGACLMAAGRRQEGAISLEKAMVLDHDAHPILFEIFPELEQDPLVNNLIEQFRS